MFDAIAYRATDRLRLYRNSLFLALDFPFSGIGPGNTFGMAYSHFQLLIPVFYLAYTHNLFLSIWLAQGLLGLLGFGGLLLSSGRLVWRGILRRKAADPSRSIGLGAAVGLVAVIFHGLTDAPQYSDAWYALLMIFGVFAVMVAAACLFDDRPLQWLALGRASRTATVILLTGVLAFAGRPLLALACANTAAVLEARSVLGANFNDAERATLHRAAIAWAERGLDFDPNSQVAMKERGLLASALSERDFSTAIRMLEPALSQSPADESICKALGYAYIWQGRVGEGVALLKEIDHAREIASELQVWPYAWRDRGRPELATRAEQAVILMAVQTQH
jgi:hypothetical protein